MPSAPRLVNMDYGYTASQILSELSEGGPSDPRSDKIVDPIFFDLTIFPPSRSKYIS